MPADGKVHDIVIPLDTMLLKRFQDDSLSTMQFELTKGMETYVLYPDPCFHTEHQAGLPSALHVYGAKLEKAGFDLSFTPARTAGVFIERSDVTVRYLVKVSNLGERPLSAAFAMTARSFGGRSTNHSEKVAVMLRPYETKTLELSLRPTRYGHHTLDLDYEVGGEKGVYPRTFVWARPRETA